MIITYQIYSRYLDKWFTHTKSFRNLDELRLHCLALYSQYPQVLKIETKTEKSETKEADKIG